MSMTRVYALGAWTSGCRLGRLHLSSSRDGSPPRLQSLSPDLHVSQFVDFRLYISRSETPALLIFRLVAAVVSMEVDDGSVVSANSDLDLWFVYPLSSFVSKGGSHDCIVYEREKLLAEQTGMWSHDPRANEHHVNSSSSVASCSPIQEDILAQRGA